MSASNEKLARFTRNGGRSPFTLIELLVVISIIAILSGLLLPVLNKARAKARQSVCLGNLKQVSNLIQSYADDFKDCYPASYDAGGKMWSEQLFGLGYVQTPSTGAPSVFMCPTGGYDGKWTGAARNTYGMWHGDAEHGTVANSAAPGYYFLNRNRMEADRIMLADSTHSKADPNWLQTYVLRTGDGTEVLASNATAYSLVHLRHNGLGNALFNDGHADSKDSGWMKADGRYFFQSKL